MSLVFERIVTEGLGDLSYLIGDDAEGTAAVIDPRADVDVYLHLARQHKLAITHVLQTHVHEDYLSGANVLAARLGNARVYSSEDHAESYGYKHDALHDGDVFAFGDTVLTARHTPGHTPEHMSFLVAEAKRPETPYAVFSGGSLLINAAGRTDLLGPERAQALASAQYRTLYDFYLGLDDHVILHPLHAHGSPCGASIGDRLSSTIGYERRFNPFLQHGSEADFVRYTLENLPPKPSYYPRLKRSNLAGPLQQGLPTVPALPLQAFHDVVRSGVAQLLDTRHMLAFGGGHIGGAINIAKAAQLPIWAGWMLDADRPLLLVLDSDDDLEQVLRMLLRTGFTRFAGYLAGGMTAWDNAGLPIVRTMQVPVTEIHAHPHDFCLIDVRSPDEWREGHLPGARHIFLPELPQRFSEVPRGGTVAVYCGSGYRASIGASLLQQAGLEQVANIPGSMQAWRHAGFPVEQ